MNLEVVIHFQVVCLTKSVGLELDRTQNLVTQHAACVQKTQLRIQQFLIYILNQVAYLTDWVEHLLLKNVSIYFIHIIVAWK